MVSCLSHLLVFCNLDLIDEMRIFGCVLCTYDSCILFINYVWASWLCWWSDLSISVALYTARVYGVYLWGHGTESMCMKARAWYLSGSQLPCQMLGWRGSWCTPCSAIKPQEVGWWRWGVKWWFMLLLMRQQAVAINNKSILKAALCQQCPPAREERGLKTCMSQGRSKIITIWMLICTLTDDNITFIDKIMLWLFHGKDDNTIYLLIVKQKCLTKMLSIVLRCFKKQHKTPQKPMKAMGKEFLHESWILRLHEGHLGPETLHENISYFLGISSVLLHVYVNMSAAYIVLYCKGSYFRKLLPPCLGLVVATRPSSVPRGHAAYRES